MKKLLIEFLGTFILSLVMVTGAILDSWLVASASTGFVLMGLIYSGGHVSGGHFNPAVSMAVFLRGRLGIKDLPAYILAQFLGSALGAAVGVLLIAGKSGEGHLIDQQILAALICEVAGTFAVCWVFLNVASSRATIGNSFYGIAMGGILVGGMITLGKISGGAFNPSLALSLGISNISGFGNIWVHWVGEALGSVGAAFVFIWVHGKD